MSDQETGEDLTIFDHFNTLTAGEAEDLEDILDLGVDHIGQLMESDRPKMKLMRAVMWVVKRRHDPEITFESLRDIPLDDLMAAPTPKADDEQPDEQPDTKSGQSSSAPSDGSPPPATSV